MNSQHKHSTTMVEEKPVFSWIPIAIHFLLANLLAWLAISLPDYHENFQPLVDWVALVIPSVAGMGELSPSPPWGEIYVLCCISGSPIYMRFVWRFGGFALPQWVKDQTPFRFWFHMIGLILAVVGALYFLKPSTHAYTSIRSADFIDMLIKESYLAFGVVALALVITFSGLLSAAVKAIQLRINN